MTTTNIIVAFSRTEDSRNIRNILVRNGFNVVAVCNSGAQAISSLDGLSGGIVVCGYRFADMLYQDIRDSMPSGFGMLLVASASRVGDTPPEGVVWLTMPLIVQRLVETLNRMCDAQTRQRRAMRQKPAGRSQEEVQIIARAKELLMARNSITESEAHRYIQKCSMDSGSNMVETAQKIISLIQ